MVTGPILRCQVLLAWLSAGCQTASVAAFMRLAASEVTVKPKSFRHSSFLLIGK